MEEGKRQKQIAGLLNEEMNLIFQRLGLNMIAGGMVSISSVKVTPIYWKPAFILVFLKWRMSMPLCTKLKTCIMK